ncbi:MAG: penicillin-binding protein 2 [Akkermansiaceae bacterium]|nr:penicillin-binding protein 2 [Akkermansiaceae bacterium]
MANPKFLASVPVAICLAVSPVGAQSPAVPDLVSANRSVTPQPPPAASGEAAPRSASDGAIFTRKDARTITLKIPPPRGMIVDRNGKPFAQNEVAYEVCLQFNQFENADRDFVINWARARLDTFAKLTKKIDYKTDDELFDHYQHRRWLPLHVSGQFSAKEAKELEPELGSGLVLCPVYRRYYPHGESAAHIVGYTGRVDKLPTGPINFNEPMWEETEGRAGLEKLFDKELTGDPGMKKLLFDENGNKLLEEQVKRPRPGGTLVTTLDLDWQLLAEKTLRNGCRRGAFVVLDAITGEVLVMASRPSFDLNSFIPFIGETEFKALNEDPARPLYGRAFQSAYPPASSFKPVVALAALNNGVVTENSTVYCPAAIAIGNKVFNNWSKIPEGSINVKRAIARSCNTWFYQVGIDVGPSAFLSLARRLGYGERTGLPLIGETSGLVPDNEWMLKHERRRILDGDTANLSIGQGVLLASPLQVAQGMACIANGQVRPKPQLISQVQDTRGRVVKMMQPERKEWLGVDNEAVEIVREGMNDVVNGGGGTGRSAGLSYTTLCGKTGTAQWGPKSKNQRLAWFAGFLPHDNPRYSFAVLYEGRPGETVSGGRMAAPMVRKFFEGIKDDIKDTIAPPKRALIVVDESGDAPAAEPAEDGPLKALPVEPLDTGRGDAPLDARPMEEPPPLPDLSTVPGHENETGDSGETPRRALPVEIEGEEP